jgi:hypothetical protein
MKASEKKALRRQLLRLLSDGWNWHMTKTGKFAHAARTKEYSGQCRFLVWERSAPSPLIADGQATRTYFCQRCVGSIIRQTQENVK